MTSITGTIVRAFLGDNGVALVQIGEQTFTAFSARKVATLLTELGLKSQVKLAVAIANAADAADDRSAEFKAENAKAEPVVAVVADGTDYSQRLPKAQFMALPFAERMAFVRKHKAALAAQVAA